MRGGGDGSICRLLHYRSQVCARSPLFMPNRCFFVQWGFGCIYFSPPRRVSPTLVNSNPIHLLSTSVMPTVSCFFLWENWNLLRSVRSDTLVFEYAEESYAERRTQNGEALLFVPQICAGSDVSSREPSTLSPRRYTQPSLYI